MIRCPHGLGPAVIAALLLPIPAHAATDACSVITRNFEASRADLATPQLSAMLFSAADSDCPALVPRLIAAGASLATRDRTGGTALTHAARSGRVDMVRLLVASGADVNQRDIGGATPLSIAIETSHGPAARALIDAGADVELAGHAGVTPLIAAAYNGNLVVLDALLGHKADPATTDGTGKPAILYAAARGFASIVNRLLNAGIDVNAIYANGLTVLSWAAGHSDDVPTADGAALVAQLLDRGAKPNLADDRGQTPLMIATAMDHADVVDILLAHGADRMVHDAQGKTAADLAQSDVLRAKLLAQSPAR